MRPLSSTTPGFVGAPAWAVGATRTGAAALRLPAALFAALLALGVAPVWLVHHVPTQDGAQHVESVLALLRLPGSALLQHFYLPNWGLQPNWLTQLLLMALVQAFAPATAEKIVLTGYLVALPLAFRAALPATARGRWAALAVFPFVHSYPFHMGFWNFSYSVVLFFVALGFWYRTRGRMGARRGVAFAALTFVLFVAHSVSTSAALAAMTAILAWRAGLGLWRARGAPARRRMVLRGYALRAAATYGWALPAIALLGWFFVRQPKPFAFRPTLFDYAKHLAGLYALVSFDRRELLVTGAVAVAIAAAVGVALWRRRGSARPLRLVDGWLAAAALYFATPDSVADGAQLNDRLALYPYFAALLWLGWSTARLATVRALAIALAALFVAGTGMRVAKYREIDRYLDEYLSVTPHVPAGSVILPLTLSPFGPREGHRIDGRKLLSYRVQVFQHTAGYVATYRNGVELDNSQANTTHTPLRWREELNPFLAMQTAPFGMEDEPPCLELWRYAKVGGRIDFVLLWGDTAAAARDACGAALLAELSGGWERVFVSRPRGLMELWRPAAAAR